LGFFSVQVSPEGRHTFISLSFAPMTPPHYVHCQFCFFPVSPLFLSSLLFLLFLFSSYYFTLCSFLFSCPLSNMKALSATCVTCDLTRYYGLRLIFDFSGPYDLSDLVNCGMFLDCTYLSACFYCFH
jgi:hypothetical protein